MKPSCQNCRHRVKVPAAVSVWVDLTEDRCREFITASFDPAKGETITLLLCADAMQRFCGLSAWKPTQAYRIKRALSA